MGRAGASVESDSGKVERRKKEKARVRGTLRQKEKEEKMQTTERYNWEKKVRGKKSGKKQQK